MSDDIKFSDKVNADIIMGENSWQFIYITLGFAISIEGTIIQMIPLTFPFNIIIYGIVALATFLVFIFNPRFQNRLFRMKQAYESRPR
jgi:hypothetical protein